jgi:cytochrome c oxidase subunit 2
MKRRENMKSSKQLMEYWIVTALVVAFLLAPLALMADGDDQHEGEGQTEGGHEEVVEHQEGDGHDEQDHTQEATMHDGPSDGTLDVDHHESAEIAEDDHHAEEMPANLASGVEAASGEAEHAHEEDEAEGHHDDGHGEGHAGHDHGKPSFKTYGLIKSESGYKEYNVRLTRFRYYPETIEVSKGDRVKLNLDSTDVEHGFFIDGYDVNVKVPEKGFKTVEFAATKSGAFRFRCSSTCGPFHPFMIGKMTVGPNYLLWTSLAGVMFFPAGMLVFIKSKRGRKNGTN